jgi:hypothetical protein
MRTSAVLKLHKHSYARQIESDYNIYADANDSSLTKIRAYNVRQTRKKRLLKAKIPKDSKLLCISDGCAVTGCPESPKKRRARHLRVRSWKKKGAHAELVVDESDRLVAVTNQCVVVEKRKPKKKPKSLRKFRLRKAKHFGSFGRCYKVKLPKGAKIVALSKRRVIVRMPEEEGKARTKRLLAVPLIDKGELGGKRYYVANVPEDSKVVGVTSKGLLFVKVGKKYTSEAEEKRFVGVVDGGLIPEGRNVGVLKHRNLGFGPTYLLPD